MSAGGSSAAAAAEDPIPSGAGQRATPSPKRPRRMRKRSARLSARERRVLRELAGGHTTEEVAQLLVVSPHTVRTHIRNCMRKLGARTRAHAVAIAVSDGAVDLHGS